MIAIIQGEILQADQLKEEEWLEELKDIFKSKDQFPECWDTFPGNTFEFEEDADKALKTLIHLMATIRKYPPLELRLAIGIGAKEITSLKNLQAHTFALDAANLRMQENLETNISLGLKSPWESLDDAMNMIFRFASLVMKDWSTRAAEIIKMDIEHPEMDQRDIGKAFGISQSSVSERLSRAHYDEILKMESFYRKQLQKLSSGIDN
jgi:predicted XRE-type DNA-binding protein